METSHSEELDLELRKLGKNPVNLVKPGKKTR